MIRQLSAYSRGFNAAVAQKHWGCTPSIGLIDQSEY